MLGVLLAIALAAASPLAADPDFVAGVSLYRELEYEQAVVKLQAAAAAPDRTAPEGAVVLVWLALCHAGLGDMARAELELKDALARDPAVVPPAEIPPKLARDLEELRAQQTAAAPAAPVDAAPEPGDAVADAAPADDPPWLLIGAGGAVATGVVALAVGGVVGAVAFATAAGAADPELYVSEADAAVSLANAELVTGVVLAGAGALIAGAGGVLAGLAVME